MNSGTSGQLRQFARRGVLLALGTLGLAGCAPWRTASIPMKQIDDRLDNGQGSRHLVVFLPGAYDEPQDFVRFGFIEELRQRRLAADAIVIDSHLGYFNDFSIAERIRDDVLQPAQARGYRSIWMVGISLGGLGSLLTAERYPGITGIVALAPYVGTRAAFDEVRRAGGLTRWRRDASTATNEWERRLLGWLGRRSEGSGSAGAELILAYGEQDRFADTLTEVAKVIEPSRVFVQPGGHDWETWRMLWRQVLDVHAAILAPTLPRAA